MVFSIKAANEPAPKETEAAFAFQMRYCMFICVSTSTRVHVLGSGNGVYAGDIINLLLILYSQVLTQWKAYDRYLINIYWIEKIKQMHRAKSSLIKNETVWYKAAGCHIYLRYKYMLLEHWVALRDFTDHIKTN